MMNELESIKRLCRDDPRRALEQATRLLERARARHHRPLTGRVLIQMARCHAMLTRFDRADTLLGEAIDLLTGPKCGLDRAEALRLRGRYSSMTGHVRPALSALLEARALFTRLEQRESLALTLSHLGALFHMSGDYEKALEHHLEALRLSEECPTGPALPDVLRHLAWTWLEMTEIDRAVACLERCLQLYREWGEAYGQCHTLCALASAHRERGELELAQQRLTAALAYAGPSNPALYANVLFEQGRLNQAQGDFEASLEPMAASRTLFMQSGAPVYAAMASYGMGRALLALERYGEALGEFREAQRLAVSCDDPGEDCEASLQLARLCEREGRLEEALAWLKRTYDLREKILGREKQRRITAVQLRFETARAMLEHERLRQRSAHLEVEVAQKSAELATAALNQGDRCRFLEAQRRALRAALREPEAKLRDAVREALQQLDRAIGDGGDWNEFSRQFELLHGDFLIALSRRFPTLTRTEVKICSLLRLNMSTKEIASILHVSVRDVENHRYRLRKKLELPTAASLHAYLAGL